MVQLRERERDFPAGAVRPANSMGRASFVPARRNWRSRPARRRKSRARTVKPAVLSATLKWRAAQPDSRTAGQSESLLSKSPPGLDDESIGPAASSQAAPLGDHTQVAQQAAATGPFQLAAELERAGKAAAENNLLAGRSCAPLAAQRPAGLIKSISASQFGCHLHAALFCAPASVCLFECVRLAGRPARWSRSALCFADPSNELNRISAQADHWPAPFARPVRRPRA